MLLLLFCVVDDIGITICVFGAVVVAGVVGIVAVLIYIIVVFTFVIFLCG